MSKCLSQGHDDVSLHNDCIHVFTAAILIVGIKWKACKYSSTCKWSNTVFYIHKTKYCVSVTMNTLQIHYTTWWISNYYAAWNIPDTKAACCVIPGLCRQTRGCLRLRVDSGIDCKQVQGDFSVNRNVPNEDCSDMFTTLWFYKNSLNCVVMMIYIVVYGL